MQNEFNKLPGKIIRISCSTEHSMSLMVLIVVWGLAWTIANIYDGDRCNKNERQKIFSYSFKALHFDVRKAPS